MFLILPSLASSNLAALGEQAARVRSAGYLHLDIEDGNFSPGITFGPDTVKLLRDYTDAELDAHLMVTDPEPYIEELRDYGVCSIAVHLESSRYPSRALNKIRQAGMRPGLALNYKKMCIRDSMRNPWGDPRCFWKKGRYRRSKR